MAVRFHLPRAVYQQMVEHARSELPNECCGVLLGKWVADGVCRLEDSVRLINALASPVEYQSEESSLCAAHRTARARQLDFVGFYHSHPTSPPVPSQKDRERNWWGEEVIHFIISLAGEAPDVRAWHLSPAAHWEADWEMEPE